MRFKPLGTDVPANPDQAETGDVVNFSLSNYHSSGFDGFSNIDAGGWLFAFDGTYFTVTVPRDAPVASNYEVRDRSTSTAASATFTVTPPIVTIFFGGAFDHNGAQIVESYETTFAASHKSAFVTYYTWTDEDDAVALIQNLAPGTRVNLVGHSYGGDTAATVAKNAGRNINMLITVDPVSWFNPSFSKVKSSCTSWYNINATGGGSLGDLVAGGGGSWDTSPKPFSTYYEVPVHHEQFAGMLSATGLDGVVSQASQ